MDCLFLYAFINKLTIDKDFLLELDDFQFVSESFLCSIIDYFIDYINLISLTREMPDIYLGAVAIEDKLMVIYNHTSYSHEVFY